MKVRGTVDLVVVVVVVVVVDVVVGLGVLLYGGLGVLL